MKTRIIIITLLFLTSLFCSLAFAGVGEWTSIGPYGGWVNALVVTPDGSALYAVTLDGGVFRSTDGGNSWTAVNTGLTNLYVRTLAIRPDTPTTLYAGTHSDQGMGTELGGVYRSTDGGNSWTSTRLGEVDVRALAIRPDIPTTMYAGTGDGVFRSTDGGDSWTDVNNGLTNLDVRALAIRPDTPTTTMYAGTEGGGVFRSTDGGDSWTAVNNGLTELNVQSLAIHPGTTKTMYAGTHGGGVFRSMDSGNSWAAINTGLTNLYVSVLAIHPDTPVLYAGTAGGVFSFTEPSMLKQSP